MLYESTRMESLPVASAQAILSGIAPDGGLFVPMNEVTINTKELEKLVDLSYQARAVFVLKQFLTDFNEEELRECVEDAYNSKNFDHASIAPLTLLNDNLAVLELWHGPTYAFKDMALQLLPRLLMKSAEKVGDESDYVILVATSGDTGKAALEGFKDVPKTKILVFYPVEGVSQVQKLQMITQEGHNVGVVAVEGNFDDTQNGVKKIFNDQEFKARLLEKGHKFSSANSINWGRLVPQIVYYFSAYLDLVKTKKISLGQEINFVVPTGNFGNILAGFYAKSMGLPIYKLICASNQNNVLTDFINTGVYDRNRTFHKTISPSMDILISSNLERLLFELSVEPGKVKGWMEDLKRAGRYEIDEDLKNKITCNFWAGFSSDLETKQRIRKIYENYQYVTDTHTAVAWDVYEKYRYETGDKHPTVIVSTASPFKFNTSVCEAIYGKNTIEGKSELEILKLLAAKTGLEIPKALNQLEQKAIIHNEVCQKEEMLMQVAEFLF
ncbi:MAG TPA: threonine synthase [Clostridia bacterium]|nr:threonine synthase [Clostridia bacterium]